MKLVRRARKSIRERRMKACMNDLTSNLAKVEMRAYKKGKQAREIKKKRRGESFGVPPDVHAGKMNPELYEIECRLYREAGLPKPKPYLGYEKDMGSQKRTTQRVGFVNFKDIISAVRKKNS